MTVRRGKLKPVRIYQDLVNAGGTLWVSQPAQIRSRKCQKQQFVAKTVDIFGREL
jgi:hypothetical protein